jgi:hypothetical protein
MGAQGSVGAVIDCCASTKVSVPQPRNSSCRTLDAVRRSYHMGSSGQLQVRPAKSSNVGLLSLPSMLEHGQDLGTAEVLRLEEEDAGRNCQTTDFLHNMTKKIHYSINREIDRQTIYRQKLVEHTVCIYIERATDHDENFLQR